jgi:CBS domain-containing protein
MEPMRQIPIREFMVKEVVSLNIGDTLADAYDKMNNHHIRHLPVVDDRNRVAGVFTTLDLNRAHSPRETEEGWWYYDKESLSRLSLRHFMTKDPVTLSPDNTLKDAAEIMAREKFGCIPIADKQNELVGIITYIDILKKTATLF